MAALSRALFGVALPKPTVRVGSDSLTPGHLGTNPREVKTMSTHTLVCKRSRHLGEGPCPPPHAVRWFRRVLCTHNRCTLKRKPASKAPSPGEQRWGPRRPGHAAWDSAPRPAPLQPRAPRKGVCARRHEEQQTCGQTGRPGATGKTRLFQKRKKNYTRGTLLCQGNPSAASPRITSQESTGEPRTPAGKHGKTKAVLLRRGPSNTPPPPVRPPLPAAPGRPRP